MDVSVLEKGSQDPAYFTGQSDRVVIAFVNNMPDAAIRSSERQFKGLLQAGAGDFEVELKGFICPGIPRSDIARATFLQSYSDLEELWDSKIDGLIVTGAEPLASSISEEPFWPALADLIDWARENTVSTIWSCLAAHAAVYRLSGVSRRHMGRKLSGLFECSKSLEHPLVAGAPQKWLVPHSRYNDLPESELLSQDFLPLTTIGAGLDTFIRQDESLFVFFQGHPEYEPQSLLLEYIRDVKRFIESESESYPDAPLGYFDSETLHRLEELRDQALRQRNQSSFAAVSRLLQGREVQNVWRSPSTIIYRNWVRYLADAKRKRKEAEVARTSSLEALHLV